jgi:hypothetical protein
MGCDLDNRAGGCKGKSHKACSFHDIFDEAFSDRIHALETILCDDGVKSPKERAVTDFDTIRRILQDKEKGRADLLRDLAAIQRTESLLSILARRANFRPNPIPPSRGNDGYP